MLPQMRTRMPMVIPRGSSQPVFSPPVQASSVNTAPVARAPSALSAPIISRIHQVKPGCGSCGRH